MAGETKSANAAYMASVFAFGQFSTSPRDADHADDVSGEREPAVGGLPPSRPRAVTRRHRVSFDIHRRRALGSQAGRAVRIRSDDKPRYRLTAVWLDAADVRR
jgi:hypothetical protein